jgi:hypothetical protein
MSDGFRPARRPARVVRRVTLEHLLFQGFMLLPIVQGIFCPSSISVRGCEADITHRLQRHPAVTSRRASSS